MDDDGPPDKDGKRAGGEYGTGGVADEVSCKGVAAATGCEYCTGGTRGMGGVGGGGVDGGGTELSEGACPERIIATSRASNALRSISFSECPADGPDWGGIDRSESDL